MKATSLISLITGFNLLLAFALSADVDSLELRIGDEGTAFRLVGPDSSQQLIVTGQVPDGPPVDYTRRVQYRIEPPHVASVDANGSVTPLANGSAMIYAAAEGKEAQAQVEVQQIETPQPINFPNEVAPLFTKFGCNGGGCHGKSGGQNGFRLSLLGFEPEEDYDYLVKEARGRRLFPASPEHSLLLLKATGKLPHGGGSRLDKESPEYQTVVRWLEQGMPYGKPEDPKVTKIGVFPKEQIVSPEAEQQLLVTAYYDDGSTRDVTRVVQYESNQKEMADVSKTGLVTMGTETGDVSVMIRFQESVDVFRATIPLGAPVENLPPVKNFIDELVYAKLQTLGLPPSEPCDDVTFLRRTSIDIAGRLPTVEELNTFSADPNPDKRQAWIDQLLESPDYANYFANKWSAILRNKRKQEPEKRGTYAFHAWVRESLHQNKPYDQFLDELMSATGDVGHNPPVAWYRAVREKDQQMQDIAQVFLGVRLQCAQCHHHPYEKWSQQDYYGFSAFFSQIGRKRGIQPGEELIFHRPGQATEANPKTQQAVKPTPLGGAPLEIDPHDDPREELADWMTQEDNPFFAQMLVNRYWKHFFSRALVEPEDDMRVTNPATNPALLNAVSDYFVESGFDLKALIRVICSSQTYQLDALPNAYNQSDKQNYSRFYPRRLTAEVLLDAIDGISGVVTKFPGQPLSTKAVQLPDDSFNRDSYFLTVFGRPEMDSACECERTQDANLAQSLHLLNSQGLQEKLTSPEGRAARLASDERPPEARIEELYLRAYSRPPSADELAFALEYLETKQAAAVEKTPEERAVMVQQAYEDLVWTIINTKEFLFNH